ncbi:hypothetical protein BJF80_00445 [Serinicoccus sp. CUA-874]|nr:hypothetical protein BJF80_00445 [Serinicoccus sp. CUA-874]
MAPAHQGRHAARVVERQAVRGRRERDQTPGQPEAVHEHLRDTGGDDGVVVEEQHPFGEGHRPGTPGDDRPVDPGVHPARVGLVLDRVGQDRREVEHVQGAQQHPHVPPGDDHHVAALDQGTDLGAATHHGVALLRTVPGVELLVQLGDPADVPFVQVAHDAQHVLQGQAVHPLVAWLVRPDAAQGVDRVPQPDEVELLHLGQHLATPPVGLLQLGVGLPDLLHALPEAEVDAPPTQLLDQQRVVVLPVTPAGGDGRDPGSVQVERGHDAVQLRVALRAEQGDAGRGRGCRAALGEVPVGVSRHGRAPCAPRRRASPGARRSPGAASGSTRWP